MERTINTLWFFCGDFSMITLAKKLIACSGTTEELEVNGYVEFVSSTPMTITPKYTNSGVTLQYSLDGITWTPIVSGSATPSANIIYFRGQATGTKSLYTSFNTSNAWTFTGSTNLECNGKLDRLLQNALGNDDDILTIGNLCFASMFYNSATLIKAPELPATTLATSCYLYMFFGCTALIVAPELPATVLSQYCYERMLENCTSLTTAPALPATVLVDSCYKQMFQGCTKIKLSTTLTGIYDTAYRIPTTGTGTSANDSLFNMFTSTGGTFTGTPTINTTYYTENTPV